MIGGVDGQCGVRCAAPGGGGRDDDLADGWGGGVSVSGDGPRDDGCGSRCSQSPR